MVCPGTYNESLAINKSVAIQGTNGRIGPKPQRCLKPVSFPGNSTVDAVITGNITVSHDGVTLKTLTIDTGGAGITVRPAVTSSGSRLRPCRTTRSVSR